MPAVLTYKDHRRSIGQLPPAPGTGGKPGGSKKKSINSRRFLNCTTLTIRRKGRKDNTGGSHGWITRVDQHNTQHVPIGSATIHTSTTPHITPYIAAPPHRPSSNAPSLLPNVLQQCFPTVKRFTLSLFPVLKHTRVTRQHTHALFDWILVNPLSAPLRYAATDAFRRIYLLTVCPPHPVFVCVPCTIIMPSAPATAPSLPREHASSPTPFPKTKP